MQAQYALFGKAGRLRAAFSLTSPVGTVLPSKEAVGSREPAQVGRPASLLRNSRDCPRVRNVFCRLWLMIREGVRANPCWQPMQVQADPGSPSLVVRRQSLTGRMHFAVVGILRLGGQVAICAADKHPPRAPAGTTWTPDIVGFARSFLPFSVLRLTPPLLHRLRWQSLPSGASYPTLNTPSVRSVILSPSFLSN